MGITLQRGQRILIKAFPNVTLERIVWAVGQTYVAVCRPEIFEEIKDEDEDEELPKTVMGFPKEDIIMVLEG